MTYFGMPPAVLVPLAIVLMLVGTVYTTKLELSLIRYAKMAHHDLWLEHGGVEPTFAAWATHAKARSRLVKRVKTLPPSEETRPIISGLMIGRIIYLAGLVLALYFAFSLIWL